MADSNALRSVPEPLPTTVKELALHRSLKSRQTLNDRVENGVTNLIEDEGFRALIDAVYDEQAVEGSLSADNIMAAMMIRNKVLKLGDSDLGHEKLATISKALNIVLRRYGFSRKERRDSIAGRTVDNNGGD